MEGLGVFSYVEYYDADSFGPKGFSIKYTDGEGSDSGSDSI